ncbi:hypothetical protein CEP54_013771 [Fusarium duplospermum]|uniref:Uncharacterized protein n=1 Tax=Fusarium duplospermum TaxID=1325734 RepID=A0A428P0M7_9HYPO|nr:hypothetical protein CEP54_013771 [Fusarium duplospermum]
MPSFSARPLAHAAHELLSVDISGAFDKVTLEDVSAATQLPVSTLRQALHDSVDRQDSSLHPVRVWDPTGNLNAKTMMDRVHHGPGGVSGHIRAVQVHKDGHLAILLIDSDEAAQQIRQALGVLQSTFGNYSLEIVPERFYVHAKKFNKYKLRCGTDIDKAIARQFEHPGGCVRHWSHETTLDIKSANWGYGGRLVLVFHDAEEARRAIHERFTFHGKHLKFV